jgi:Uma2 family endonuclease
MTLTVPPSFPLPWGDTWTVSDLDAFPESSLIEVIDGALIVNPPANTRHAAIQVQVAMWLDTARATFGGTVLTEPGVGLADTNGVVPDVVLSKVPGDDTIWLHPADVRVVVEILSPSTRNRDLGRKRELYHEAGITYVIVDPAERSITVYDDDPHGLDVDALAARLGWS